MMTRISFLDLVPNTATAHQGPLTVSSAAVTLLSLVSGGALHANTKAVQMAVETDQVRICVDGATPTATKGYLVNPGERVWLTRREADLAKLIRLTTDAKLQLSEFTTT